MSTQLDLGGTKLTVAVTANPPHVLKGFINKEPIVTKVGYELKILDIMSQKFNFSYSLKDTDGDSGRMLADGSWTGVIGLVANRSADIGFGGVTITLDRLQVVDFLRPHLTSAITFITNWPKPVSASLTEVMNIDGLVFLYLFISVLLLVTMLNVIGLYFPSRRCLPLTWTLLVVFMRQRLNHKVAMDRLTSLRTLLIVWQFTSLVLTIIYSGFIYKSFATPKKFNTINSLYDLADAQKRGDIHVYINKNSARYTELKESTRSSIKSIYSRLKFTKPGQSGVEFVRNSRKYLAYVDYEIKFRFELYKRGEPAYHIANDMSKAVFRSSSFAFAIRRDFPHTKHFQRLMRGVLNSGLIKRWLDLQVIAFCGFEHRYNPDKIGQMEHDAFDSADNHHAIFNSITRIVCAGIGFSLITFSTELLFFIGQCLWTDKYQLAYFCRKLNLFSINK